MNIASTYTLCKTKIKRNEEMAALMELDNKICKLELVISYRKINNNIRRIKKINEVNDLERKQMYDYTFERNNVIDNMTSDINKMDNNIIELKAERIDYIQQMYDIADRVKLLNESLPNTIFIGPEKQIAVQEHEKRCIP
jgi:hypothetical protein